MSGFDVGVAIAFVAVLVRSGAALLPATLGAIVTEKSGVTNLGVEGVMVFGAMVAYGIAFTSGDPVLGIVVATIAGGLLCVTHAVPVVKGRVSQERQFVLGLILVFLGDALSRILGQPFVSKPTAAIDQRFMVPLLSNIPVAGEMFFQQRALVYWSYAMAVVVWFVLAGVYALVPGLDMPGYARVWGAGAVVFLVLAAILALAAPGRR